MKYRYEFTHLCFLPQTLEYDELSYHELCQHFAKLFNYEYTDLILVQIPNLNMYHVSSSAGVYRGCIKFTRAEQHYIVKDTFRNRYYGLADIKDTYEFCIFNRDCAKRYTSESDAVLFTDVLNMFSETNKMRYIYEYI